MQTTQVNSTYPEIETFILSAEKQLEIDDVVYATRYPIKGGRSHFLLATSIQDRASIDIFSAIAVKWQQYEIPFYFASSPSMLHKKAVSFLEAEYSLFLKDGLFAALKLDSSEDLEIRSSAMNMMDKLHSWKKQEQYAADILKVTCATVMSQLRTKIFFDPRREKYLDRIRNNDSRKIIDPNITFEELIVHAKESPFEVANNYAMPLFAMERNSPILATFIDLYAIKHEQ